MTTFYYIASFVTLVLITYAAYLLFKLRRQKALHAAAKKKSSEKYHAQMIFVVDSIVSISKTMQQGQCPTIEGCIRLKVLIDQLRMDEKSREPFAIFYTIYDKTEHIPTHQAWTELEKHQQMKFTQEMMILEAQYQDEVKEAVDKAVEHFKQVAETL
ncbi:DUF2489 domain-containing protein [Kangiella sp. HD9-110m-PIT-SAG07]|nr:DUF2489 domain-containing protein [Kangiella sp. HD9-110m-PIT-SAG07]